MKAFIVFVEQVAKSVDYAQQVLSSMQLYQTWQPELLPGVTPRTLPLYEAWFPFQDRSPSRIEGFREQLYDTYLTKKSCFFNHVRVWYRCLELGEPVAFVEHDAVCVRDWDESSFDGVLILNAESALKQSAVRKHLIKTGHAEKLILEPGKNIWQVPITNRHWQIENPPVMMPGTAAYAIAPCAAERLLRRVEYEGWEQSDHFINTDSAVIEYVTPQYFNLALKNLQLSHGLNI